MAAAIMLLLYVTTPNHAYYSAIGAILAKLYANSLLVMFNSRIRIIGSRNMPLPGRCISSDDSNTAGNIAGRVLSPRTAAMTLPGIQEQVTVSTDEETTDETVSTQKFYREKNLAQYCTR